MKTPLRLLLAEDNPDDSDLILRELRRADFDPLWERVDTEAGFRASLRPDLDVILSDFAMPQFSGLRALEVLRESGADIPFILISGTIGEETAVSAMQHGAADYLLKDRLARLGPAVERAMEEARSRRQRKMAAEKLEAQERETRQMAKQLETEHARLVAAQAVANIGSWETDLATSSMVWSEQTHRIFETDPAVFRPTQARFLELVHPEDLPAVHEAFVQSLTGRSDSAIEHRLLLADGRVKFVEERWSVRVDGQGRAVRAIGTCQDITARKSTETEIQRTSDLVRAVAEGTPDAVFVKDLQGRYLLFNEAAARSVGRSVQDVLGQDDNALLSAEDARVVMAADRRVIESNQAQIVEEVLTSAGAKRTYLATKAPYRNAHGKVIGLLGISRDISDRKRAEEALRLFRNLVDQSNDTFEVIDPETGRFLDVNANGPAELGYSRAEYLALRVFDLDPTIPQAAWPQLSERMRADGFLNIEGSHRRKDGTTFPVEIRAKWVQLDRDYIIASVRNITERKKLEAQFLRAQRMESIGLLAGGIAHDLNNVLAPILMSIAVLRDIFPGADGSELCDTLENSAQRGAALVQQLLSFARGAGGQRIPVNPIHILRELLKLMQDTFPKSVSLSFTASPDLWTITGDPTQLHQVLLNLCVNARDAMPLGGELTLRVENVVLDESYATMSPDARPGPAVRIELQDTGVGIPPEIMDRIFEPFFTTKEIGKGTGLGLSTTLAIVKSHGGFINVYSEVGKGAKFVLYFPANPRDTSEEDAAPEQIRLPRGNGELVLVVDDEAGIRKIASQTLERSGYRVLQACHGAEAVGIYAQHRFEISVVLTDMAMPVMDGPALILALKTLNPNVSIIASSGLASTGGLAKAAAAGVRHFVAKPYTSETILKTLREVLSEIRPGNPSARANANPNEQC